ncbi:MAG: hypothetical protein Ct9H90mP4_03530 [Gammaproteobacteria bacterium]|nr:MAG: hypothetical protein Ct9H90mP4_03530 [Gammaproteobacteria bacterium]
MSKISPLVDSLISSIQCLPGVGPKTARRMVLHILEMDREAGMLLAKNLKKASNMLVDVRNVGSFLKRKYVQPAWIPKDQKN